MNQLSLNKQILLSSKAKSFISAAHDPQSRADMSQNTAVLLCRYFSVYIASSANELSRERRDQTQGAAEEAAGRLLRQVRSFHWVYFCRRLM